MTSTGKEENCWHSGRGKPQSHLDAQMSQHRCVLEAPYLNLPENVLRMCSMCTLITLKSTSFGIYVTLYVIFLLLGLSYKGMETSFSGHDIQHLVVSVAVVVDAINFTFGAKVLSLYNREKQSLNGASFLFKDVPLKSIYRLSIYSSNYQTYLLALPRGGG